MVPRDESIETLLKSLPEHARAIERAYAESSRFRSICADFHSCSQALTYWERIESGDTSVYREEYEELLRELEQEILGWLEAREGLPGPQGDSPTEADED